MWFVTVCYHYKQVLLHIS